jgi:uncharacterized membrane protein
MKITNTILIILIVSFLSIAATVGVTKMSERSTSQVVIVKTDANALVGEMNTYYIKGYRVVFMVSQGWVEGSARNDAADYSKTTPVIVVMEK